MTQFAAMSPVVTSFKKIGEFLTGFTDSSKSERLIHSASFYFQFL